MFRYIPAAVVAAGLMLFDAPAAPAGEWRYDDPSAAGSGESVDAGQGVRKPPAAEPSNTRPSDDADNDNVLSIYNVSQHVEDVDDYWHYTSALYSKQTDIGKIIGQLNRASRKDDAGVQAKLSAYPELSDEEYMHLSYAYSDSVLFPEHYAYGELFTNRDENIGFSVGAGRYEFDALYVNVLTGSVSVYDGYSMYRYRPEYYSPNEGGSGWLHHLLYRRYFEGEEKKYVSLEGSIGEVPDLEEPESISSFILKHRSLFASYQFPVNDPVYMKVGAGYTEEELPGGRDREKLSLLAGVFFQF